MPQLTLVSHELCPYVQRAAILLTEKAVPFERVYIDLGAKPNWFLALSPLGKVPVLIVKTGAQRRAIFESHVILDYLEETTPQPLYPSDPLDRAETRAWIAFGSALLDRIAGFYNAPDQASLEGEAMRIAGMFGQVEARLGGGLWFQGNDFGLIDAVFGPVFRYFDVFDRIADFGIFDAAPKTRAWRQHLAARPSVAEAVTADYDALLETFIARRNSALSALQQKGRAT